MCFPPLDGRRRSSSGVIESNRCASDKEGFKTDYMNAKIDSITRQYFGDSKYGKFGWPTTPVYRLYSKPLIFVQGEWVDYQEPAEHNGRNWTLNKNR